ncbi:MAG TPA: hypothetical protein VI750_12565, partial [Pyrinomonadaceae bacterium]|nr:hypothetical protein [Pyrinomonadaceae bacterium]
HEFFATCGGHGVPPYKCVKDETLPQLQPSYEQRSFFIALLNVETVLDNLRPDPRFNELLKRLNLPE